MLRYNSKLTSRILLRDGQTRTIELHSLLFISAYTKARYDAVYNQTCDTDVKNLDRAIKRLEPLYFWGKPINPDHYWPFNGLKYPPYFHTTYPAQLLYVQFIEDAIVTVYGDVISRNLKLILYTCSQDLVSVAPPNYKGATVYEEVFVITQYWGDQFFHKMVESLPRISPYLRFLRDNPSIKIHVAERRGQTAALLSKLGIDETRLISGVVRALFLYLPQATPCGFPRPLSLQLMSKAYRESITATHPTFNSIDKDVSIKNSIVLIQRSGWRRFTEAQAIQQRLQEIADEFHFKYHVFIDNPTPTLDESMEIFFKASLVVAPHGAGLSNLIFSRPGTFVIEAVCNPPHVNMCYQWSSHVMGHRYHAVASRGGCEDFIDADNVEIDWVARRMVKQILEEQKEQR